LSNRKEKALEYYDRIEQELRDSNIGPESELYQFTLRTIERARNMTQKLPAHMLEMIK